MQLIRNTFLSLALLCTISSISQEKYISLNEIVKDSARIFTQNQLEELKTKLTVFESETTNQLAILTIRELGNETIETYANGIFNKSKLGLKEKGNGILILFAKEDREVRIEVGYGLEPHITDAIASRIIRNTMIPKFKEELYFNGINAAVDELILYLKNPEVLKELKTKMVADEQKDKEIGTVFLIGFLSLFIGVGAFTFFKSYKNLINVFRDILVGKLGIINGVFMIPFIMIFILFGLVFIVIPLGMGSITYGFDIERYMYLLDEPKKLLWLLIPFFGITFLIALIRVRLKGKQDLKVSWFTTNNIFMRKSFSSSGSHSFSSSSSSSGSSGGFSGGGGSSGGGGASGSW